MRKIVCLFITLFIFISTPATLKSEPILGSELYKNSKINLVNFDPSGKWITAYFQNEQNSILELIEITTKKRLSILVFDQGLFLEDYEWIDANSLYFRFYDNVSKKSYKRIADISIDSEPPSVVIKKVSSQGYLLNALPEQEDTVIYALKYDDEFRIYTINTQNLSQGKFKDSDLFEHHMDNAAFYYYDTLNDTFSAVAFDKESEGLKSWYFDKKTSSWKLLYQWPDKDFSFAPVSRLDEVNMLVLTNKDTDRIVARKFNIQSQKFGEIIFEHPKYDIDSVGLEGKTKKIAWISYYDHGRLSKNYLEDSSKNNYIHLNKLFMDKQFSVVASAPSKNKSIIFVFSSDDPGRYILYDDITHATQVIEAKHPNLDDKKLAKNQLISVKNSVDNDIEAFLTLPVDYDNKTLLVMPHGGPIGVRDYDTFSRDVQYLTSRGYSVLRVNFTGSSGYGKKFIQQGIGEFGRKIEKDINLIVEHVSKQYSFLHTCAIGTSYGGYSSILLSIMNPDRYECAVGMYGVYDLPLLFNESNYKVQEDYREYVAGVVGKYDSSLKAVSPTYLVEKVRSPILLIAGLDDETAVIEQTNRLKYLLKSLGKSVDTIYYKGVKHGHDNWIGEMHQMAYVDDFLRQHLKIPTPKTDAFKAADLEEDIILADSFEFEDFVKDDTDKAFKYYSLAANNGHARAMYNLSYFYLNGRGISKNVTTAIQWMKKSSEAGSAIASYSLGVELFYGSNTKKDLQQAFHYFEIAEKLGFDARARLFLARMLCSGRDIKKDFSRCINYLDLEILNASENDIKNYNVDWRGLKFFNEVIAELMVENDWSNEELKELRRVVIDKLNLDYFTYNFKLDSHGIFLYNPVYGKTRHDEEKLSFSANENLRLGVDFKLKPIDSKNLSRTAVLTKWTRIDPAENESNIVFSGIIYGKTNKNWTTTFDPDEDAVPGTSWRIEIFTLDKKRIFSKTYTLLN